MSAKARSLLKKLRSKKIQEEGDKKKNEESDSSSSSLKPIKKESKNARSVPKYDKKKEEPFIDPLDYFKTEHIVIKETNMEEYSLAAIKKEVAEENKREKEEENITKIGGMVGVRGFKVNFEEMMKARSKVKNETQQRALSVGTRNKNNDKVKYEYVKKNSRNKEDNLFIKLILAKNKLNTGNNPHLYSEIIKRIDELKEIKDLPKDISKKLYDIINGLKLPKNLVLCSDVQVVSDDEDDTDSIGKNISLDQVIKRMNFKDV